MYRPAVAPDEFLRLIADAGRWQLLQELAASERRVTELVARSGRPQNLVSYHLRELRDAGLVSSRRSTADGRDTYYRLEVDRFAHLFGEAGAVLHPGLRLTMRASDVAPARVLFLCTGNSARSQMAEGLMRHLAGGAIDARSAGSQPKVLHPNAVRVLAERGIDISGQSAKHLRRFARTRFDRVVTLCDRVREICPEFPGEPVTVHWSVPDPSVEGDTDEASYPAFVRTAEELESRITLLLAQLAEQPEEVSHGGSRRQRSLSRR